MKKRWILVTLCVLIAIVMCACASDGTTVKLSDKISILETGMTISIPDSWEAFNIGNDDFLVMSLQANGTGGQDYSAGYADIYFTDYDEYEFSLALALEQLESYYVDSIIGSPEKLEIDGMDAYRFEQSMVYIGDDGVEYNYHGYEYVIDTPNGVLEIDIYYSQDKMLGKVFKPSERELELLTRIAQSVEID